MFRINKIAAVGILSNLTFITAYIILSQFRIKSYTLVLFCAILSFVTMLFIQMKINEKKINLCTIFLALCFLFYFGQFVEFGISGKVENVALNITKHFKQNEITWVGMVTLIYVHVLQNGMILASGMKEHNRKDKKFNNCSLSIIRHSALFIYIIAYPFALYYQYSRFKYSITFGYGGTLLSNLASSSQLLRFGEFFTGFVISMYILLVMAYKGKKSEYIVVLSIIPYFVFYILSGSRLQVALILIVLLLVRHYWFKPISFRDIIVIFIAGIIGIYVITISSEIRNYLGMYNSVKSAITNALTHINLLSGINHLFDEFGCQIVSIACVLLNCPEPIPFNYGKLYLYGLERIIPNLFGVQRVFFTENTDDSFKYLINNGNTGLGSSFISETYYSFGFFGIALVFLLGLLIWKTSRKIEKSDKTNILQSFIGFYTAYCVIFTVRSDAFNILNSIVQYCLFPIFCIYILNGLINNKRNNKI